MLSIVSGETFFDVAHGGPLPSGSRTRQSKAKKITGVLQIDNVDLMLEGIDEPWAFG